MGKGWACKKKPGTKNTAQAVKRDKRAADARAADRAAAEKVWASPPVAKKKRAKTTPVTEPAYETSASEMAARRWPISRRAYQRLRSCSRRDMSA